MSSKFWVRTRKKKKEANLTQSSRLGSRKARIELAKYASKQSLISTTVYLTQINSGKHEHNRKKFLQLQRKDGEENNFHLNKDIALLSNRSNKSVARGGMHAATNLLQQSAMTGKSSSKRQQYWRNDVQKSPDI